MYEPSALALKLAARAGGRPIAEKQYADGLVVIVFEDGRKLKFPPESYADLNVTDNGRGSGSDIPTEPPAPSKKERKRGRI